MEIDFTGYPEAYKAYLRDSLRRRLIAALRGAGRRKYLDKLNERVATMLDPEAGVQ